MMHTKWIETGAMLVALSLSPGLHAQSSSGPNHVPADYQGRPETDRPQMIPGVIRAVKYDVAPGDKPGITFSYQGAPRTSDFRAGTDSIGLAAFGDDHINIRGEPEKPGQAYVGWTQPHEWLKYTVQVQQSGVYQIGGKFAAGAKDATLTFSFGPDLSTGPLKIPTTDGFQPGHEVYHVWETLDDLGEIKLDAGRYVMKVEIGNTAQLNLETFSFTKK
jgi:hypothetical protein